MTATMWSSQLGSRGVCGWRSPAAPAVRYTEFTMFKHLDPTKVRLPLVALARELGKFYLFVYPVFRRAVVP